MERKHVSVVVVDFHMKRNALRKERAAANVAWNTCKFLTLPPKLKRKNSAWERQPFQIHHQNDSLKYKRIKFRAIVLNYGIIMQEMVYKNTKISGFQCQNNN